MRGAMKIITRISRYAKVLNNGVKKASPMAIIEAIGMPRFLYVMIVIVLEVISLLRRNLWFFVYDQLKYNIRPEISILK
jgi:hypothetical protein